MSEKRVDEVDLRKCPLCGCDAVYTYEDGHGTNPGEKSNYVSCGYNDCMPEPICFHYDVWQNRPAEDKLRDEIDYLRKQLEDAKANCHRQDVIYMNYYAEVQRVRQENDKLRAELSRQKAIAESLQKENDCLYRAVDAKDGSRKSTDEIHLQGE